MSVSAPQPAINDVAQDNAKQIGRAKQVYVWLWLSFFLTLPTTLFLVFNGLNFLNLGRQSYDSYQLGSTIIGLASILGAGMWHLVLLQPALDRKSEFVRWHGRQALLLAGSRTAVALVLAATFRTGLNVPLACVALLVGLWFFGTIWGQQQAGRGECSLMRWAGKGAALPLQVLASPAATPAGTDVLPLKAALARAAVDADIATLRFSQDWEKRREAVAALERAGLVESL
jgi:uncharacterized membrane protein